MALFPSAWLQKRESAIQESQHHAFRVIFRDPANKSQVVAVKTTLSNRSNAALTQILLEARLHACLAHRNLVTLLAVQGTFLLIMLGLEYCSDGDLRQWL